MLYTLKMLHQDGIPLAPDQIAAAPHYTGNLIVQDWPQGSTFNRHIRVAKLLNMSHPTVHPDIIPPLFDPVLVKMTDQQMHLHGYQIDGESGRHYAQVWVLQAADPERKPTA